MFALFLSLFAVFFVQGLGSYLESEKEIEPQQMNQLKQTFGTVTDAMLTLFILMTCPNLYEYEDQQGLLQAHPFLTLFMCAFITFGTFGVVALLSGIITQSMYEKNEARKELIRQEHEAMRAQLGSKCEELFGTLPVNASGEAAVEIVKVLAPAMWNILTKVGANMTHADVETIIDFMDVNGTGLVSSIEFRSTMEKIAEGLTPLGIQEITNRIGVCEVKINKIQDTLDLLWKRNMALQAGLKMVLNHIGVNPHA